MNAVFVRPLYEARIDGKPAMVCGKLHKGVAYFPTHSDAALVAASFGGRVVEYTRGFAAQYEVSGPYWPERETLE